jgi:hypothetical protein
MSRLFVSATRVVTGSPFSARIEETETAGAFRGGKAMRKTRTPRAIPAMIIQASVFLSLTSSLRLLIFRLFLS